MNNQTDKYPMIDKVMSVEIGRQIIWDFIEWADSKGHIGVNTDRVKQILAEYYEIDLIQLEKEQCMLLEELEKSNVQ
jgi:hypothetical protein